MMKYLQLFLLIFMTILASQQLKAQTYPRLDTLYTSPANPSPTDTVLLIYEITHNREIGTINQQLLLANTTYSLNLCQQQGLAAVMSTYRDTVKLAPMSARTYHVVFTLQQGYSYNTGYCQSNGGAFVQGNHTFTVSQMLQVQKLPKGSVQIAPNPIGEQPLSITAILPITRVQCYHSSGALVYNQQVAEAYSCTVPLEEQASGVYYLVVETAKGRYTQKIIKIK